MSVEPTAATGAPPPQRGEPNDDARRSRPWTPAAAMEPVLPLAPPPARPGAGRPVNPGEPRPATGSPVSAVVMVAIVGLLVVVLVVLLLTGRL